MAAGSVRISRAEFLVDFIKKLGDVAGPVVMWKSLNLLIEILGRSEILAMLGIEPAGAKIHRKAIKIVAVGLAKFRSRGLGVRRRSVGR